MKRILLASFCLILLAGCHMGKAPPPIEPVQMPHATVVYYNIRGSTADELRARMDARGPVSYDGYKGAAATAWHIRWTWPGYGRTPCDLNAATVSYDIQVTMPRWNPPASADPELVARWAAYSSALAAHEQGHVDWVIEHVPSVTAAIQNATCETADAAAQAVLDSIRQHDLDYDAETNHGATQGARFP